MKRLRLEIKEAESFQINSIIRITLQELGYIMTLDNSSIYRIINHI